MQKSLVTLIVFLLLATSCTMEKRRYNKGWHVEYFGNNKGVKNKSQQTKPRSGHYVNVAATPALQGMKDSSQLPIGLSEYTSVTEATTYTDQLITNARKSAAAHIAETRDKNSEQSVSENIESGSHKTEVAPKSDNTLNLPPNKKAKIKSDWMLYVSSGLMTFLAIFSIGRFRKQANKVTRWARTHTFKTKIAIAAIQLTLGAMAYWAGYNLNELGLEFSSSLKFVALALVGAGLALVPFFKRATNFILPKKLQLQRIGFIGATLAFLLLAVDNGSHIKDNQHSNLLQSSMQQVDQTIFTHLIKDMKSSGDATNIKTDQLNQRKKVVAGLTIGAVLLLILLAVLFCAGVCTSVYGAIILIEGIGWSVGYALAGLGLMVLGALIIALVLKAWTSIIQNAREDRREQRPTF